MTSPFDRLERIASRAIDRTNAVQARWTPMDRPPNGRARPDPVRPPASIRGVFDLRQRHAGIQLGNRDTKGGNDFRFQRESPSIEFSMDVRQLGARTAPRQGDRLEIAGTRYEITSAQPGGHSRLVCALVRA